jgi:hypothetical protein
MNKIIVQAVLEEYGLNCVICGSSDIELHHIVKGRGKRKEHENKYSVVPLCPYHHRGTKGVHGRDGRKLDLYLKKQLQEKYFEMGYTENEVREMMGGKLY